MVPADAGKRLGFRAQGFQDILGLGFERSLGFGGSRTRGIIMDFCQGPVRLFRFR